MGDFMGYHKISTTRLLLPHPAHLDMLAMAAHINYAVNSLVAEWGPWLQKNKITAYRPYSDEPGPYSDVPRPYIYFRL